MPPPAHPHTSHPPIETELESWPTGRPQHLVEMPAYSELLDVPTSLALRTHGAPKPACHEFSISPLSERLTREWVSKTGLISEPRANSCTTVPEETRQLRGLERGLTVNISGRAGTPTEAATHTVCDRDTSTVMVSEDLRPYEMHLWYPTGPIRRTSTVWHDPVSERELESVRLSDWTVLSLLSLDRETPIWLQNDLESNPARG